MSRKPHRLPAGHVLAPALLIGSMALVLALGLETLRILEQVNSIAGRWLAEVGLGNFSKSLPVWLIWLATGLVAYGLSAAILCVPCIWRRLVLWISTLAILLFWVPVLGLATYVPDIAAPLIAAVWSGICALVYAYNHRMPVDELPISQPDGQS